MFGISLSKPPSRNSMFIRVVCNEDKIISFLYIIYFNMKRKYENLDCNEYF